MTVADIMNGSGEYPGLIPLVREFLKAENAETQVIDKMESYLSFLSKRASGKLVTNATWIRSFVLSHPSYKQNSVVTNEITFDLMKTIEQIERREIEVPELYGDFYSE